MKKITSILLVFVFLVSTLGLSFTVDYCPMKKDYSFSLQGEKSCCCKKSDENNCCNSKHVSFKKIEDNYVGSDFQAPTSQVILIFHEKPTLIIKPLVFSKTVEFYKDSKPPGSPVSLSILYRSILI